VVFPSTTSPFPLWLGPSSRKCVYTTVQSAVVCLAKVVFFFFCLGSRVGWGGLLDNVVFTGYLLFPSSGSRRQLSAPLLFEVGGRSLAFFFVSPSNTPSLLFLGSPGVRTSGEPSWSSHFELTLVPFHGRLRACRPVPRFGFFSFFPFFFLSPTALFFPP